MKSKLAELFKKYNIVDITVDSRAVKPNYAFFAITGYKLDGNNYIDKAIENGANLIFTDNLSKIKHSEFKNIFYLQEIRAYLSIAAGIFYPALPAYLFAITGTNGKTSTAHYVQQFFNFLGKKSASIGTLGIIGPDVNDLKKIYADDNLTTPGPITLRKILNELAKKNINYIALEAGSHGIDQKRLFGIEMQACGFTSFSQDHLDYHETLENYLNAKLKLFTENLSDNKTIILNSDMEKFDIIIRHLKTLNKKLITVGRAGDLKIINILSNINGQEVTISYQDNIYKFHTDIIGDFQIYNILIAVLLACEGGLTFEKLIDKIPFLKAPIGRLERVTTLDDEFQIFIDYAHTPDAIEKALTALKELQTKGSLKILFGCGGDRDKSKRPLMGEVANFLADQVIITDDNPRFEEPSTIRQEILEGAPKAIELEDREEAIKNTILKLKKDDILLIAGKGHEDYQIIKDKKIFFSDLLIARAAVLSRV